MGKHTALPQTPRWWGGAVSPLSKNQKALTQPFRLLVSALWASPRPRNVDFVPTPLAALVSVLCAVCLA